MEDIAATLPDHLEELGVQVCADQLQRCVQMCIIRGISSEEFAELWAAHLLSTGVDADCPRELQRFERRLDDEVASAPVAPAIPAPSHTSANNADCVIDDYLTTPKNTDSNSDVIMNNTVPAFCPDTFSAVSHSDKYSTRINSGKIMCSYGNEGKLSSCVWTNMSGDVCRVKEIPNESNATLTSKAMHGFELLQKKVSILDNNMKYLAEYILNKVNIKEALPVKCKSQVPITIAGRVECDANGRLNPQSVLLQGTWEDSLGHNVRLELDLLQQYSLFPGQIVAMTGLNPRGDKFSVQEMHSDGSLLPPGPISLDNNINGPLQIVVACGPFTTSDSLSFEPLTDLLKHVTTNRPHVLMLIGPFLDANHQSVLDNSISETYRAFFEKLVDKIMTAMESSKHTQVVLVSSSKDVFHTNVYPTPPFFIKRNYPNLTVIPDPSMLNIGGVNIGVTGTDILMHLSKEEISMPLQGPDKLGRLVNHLFAQQNFYPLWPPNINLSVDTTLWSEFCCMNITPHILIIPSDFRYFIKEINNCVAINPERLVKGTNAGTFLRLQVSSSGSNSDSLLCEVVKI